MSRISPQGFKSTVGSTALGLRELPSTGGFKEIQVTFNQHGREDSCSGVEGEPRGIQTFVQLGDAVIPRRKWVDKDYLLQTSFIRTAVL